MNSSAQYYQLTKSLLLALFLSGIAASTSAQTYTPSIKPEREVIVMFKSNTVVPPEGRTAGRPDEFQIPEQGLRQILLNANVEAVSRLMPDFEPEDRYTISRTGEAVQLTDWTHVYILRLPQAAAREEFLNALKNRPEVIYAEVNGRGEPDLVPTDPYFNRQWALKNDGTSIQGSGTPGADIKAYQAWDITTGSNSVTVGIVDGGMQANHPDFSGRVTGDTGDNNSHGTGVAGVAAAQGNNSVGVAGVAWNVGIINEDYGAASDADLAAAVRSAADRGAYVINNSWKLIPVGRSSTTVRAAFADIYKQNRTAVASMGNQSGEVIQYPAAFGQGILTIGATTNEDIKAVYSSTGNWIDVVAPGGAGSGSSDVQDDIYTTVPGSSYGYVAGTSFAAPVASGIAALLLSVNPNLYNDDIEQIIRLSAEDVNSGTYPGWDQYLGTGRVNAKKALELISSPNEVKHWTANGGSSVGNTGYYTMTFYSTPGLADGVYIVKRYDVRETVTFPETFGSTPDVWGRGVGTNGYSAANPNHGMGRCTVISGSVTTTGATLRTYVYQVWKPLYLHPDLPGEYVGWFPTTPSGVTFAYTALGDPPPATPQNLTVTAYPGPKWDCPKLSWDPVSDTDLKRYKVTRTPDGGLWYTTDTYIIDYDVEICPYDYVTYTVMAEDMAGQFSAPADKTTEGCYGKELADIDDGLPVTYALSGAHPNPFNPSTTIQYDLPEASQVTLVIYDVMGREVMSWEKMETAGYQGQLWPGTNAAGQAVPSGIYIYRLVATPVSDGESFSATRKMLLLK